MIAVESKEASFKGKLPLGDTNLSIEITAEEDGLSIDDCFTVPWEWIQEQMEKLSIKPNTP